MIRDARLQNSTETRRPPAWSQISVGRSQRVLGAGVAGTAGMMVVAGALLLAGLMFAGCRTTEGAGRDIERLGDNIADSADKHKP